MDQATWNTLSPHERATRRDLSNLSPQLTAWKGWRVEVVDTSGEKRRFIVGVSTGWKPIHLEIKTRRSMGGEAAERTYQSVTPLYIAR
jgi:hypothetical protein